MTDQKNRTGRCLCGTVSYELAAAPDQIGACHCSMCQRFSGGVLLAAQVPSGGITWKGAEHIATYASSNWAERGFCKTCGSSLFWRMTAPGPAQGMLALPAGTLDSLEGLDLTSEIFFDHKPAAYAFAGDTKKMTEAEVIAAFAPAGGTPEDGQET